MKDRVPVNPGRVLITPETGNAYYATLTRADNPRQEGDPLNKNTLLKDATAELLGGDASMLPDEAFLALFKKISSITPSDIGAAKVVTGTYTGTGKVGSSNPTSLTFPFAPKAVFILSVYGDGRYYNLPRDSKTPGSTMSGDTQWVVDCNTLTTSYAKYNGFGDSRTSSSNTYGDNYGKKSSDGKTIYWYNTYDDAGWQLNASNYKYYYMAIG